ncbi:MAG: hypothetical protein CHACPFDD_03487 [Phycisphaerae bacterium]|nr:hypothetical protein [Phycisphaerae bacterium]
MFHVRKGTPAMPRPGWLTNWLERHQTRVSFWLHVVGIPLTVLAVVLAGWQLYHGLWPLWWRPAALLVLGYALQAAGHWFEGNDMGEIILVKRALGRPYVAVADQFLRRGRSAGAVTSTCARR